MANRHQVADINGKHAINIGLRANRQPARVSGGQSGYLPVFNRTQAVTRKQAGGGVYVGLAVLRRYSLLDTGAESHGDIIEYFLIQIQTQVVARRGLVADIGFIRPVKSIGPCRIRAPEDGLPVNQAAA